MNNATQQIVNKAWNFAHVLRDDGLSYMAYTEQITFLLFLKMADEQTKPPYKRKPLVPSELGWASPLAKIQRVRERASDGKMSMKRRVTDGPVRLRCGNRAMAHAD